MVWEMNNAKSFQKTKETDMTPGDPLLTRINFNLSMGK